MPVHPKGYFYQLHDNGAIDEDTRIGFDHKFADPDLNERQMILYATYELRRHYDLFETFKIRKFSLRKPFFIFMTLGEQRYEFICQTVPASCLGQLKSTDLPFRLKKSLFVVLPKNRQMQKTKTSEKPIPPSDLNRLLNTIDARVQREFNAFSPIIYTGMTN